MSSLAKRQSDYIDGIHFGTVYQRNVDLILFQKPISICWVNRFALITTIANYSRSCGQLHVASVVRVCYSVQYRHLIPAPIDRASASARLYKYPLMTCQEISQAQQRPT